MWQNLKVVGLASLTLASGGLMADGRVDAVNEIGNTWQPLTWSAHRVWQGYQYARDGGVATFSQGGKIANDRGAGWEYFNQDVTGLELKGLNLGSFYTPDFKGKPITFVGEWPWIQSSQTTVGNEMILNVALQGKGANTLVKKGTGRIVANGAVSDFASLDVNGGAFVIQEDRNAFGVPVTVKSGGLSFEPKTAGASATVDAVAVGGGIGYLSAQNGGTLTVNSLTKRPGAVLNVKTAGGARVKVANKASVTAPDGGFVSLPGDGTVKFLDYDETDGWKVGDSMPANAVVCTGPETGALTFADEGYVWSPAVAGGASLKVTGPISAPNGVTFSTASDNSSSANRTKLDCSSLSGVTVPMRFNGMIVKGVSPTTFGAGTDVWICGDGSDIDKSAVLSLDAKIHKEADYNLTLHLAGAGGNYALTCSGADWQYKTLNLAGPTVLEGDATIGADASVVAFKGPVSGPGGLRLVNGFARLLNANNSFAGDLEVENGAAVSVYTGGSLGSGDIKLKGDTGRLYFHGLTAPMNVTNYFTGKEGVLAVQNGSKVTLAHSAAVRTTYVQKTSELKLGGDLRTDHIYLDHDSKIAACGGDVTLTTANTDDSVLAGTLADGADGEKLSLVKTGTNRLVVCGTNNTYSGLTSIDGGTVVLGGSLFSASDVSWWIDASDPSTLTVTNGRATEVRSKIGTFKFTGSATSTSEPAPDYVTDDDYFNGLPFIRFVPQPSTLSTHPKLNGSSSVEMRTVFIVCRTRTGSGVTHHQAALINYNSADISLRVNASGDIGTSNTQSQDFWPTAGYGRQNGVRKTGGISTVAIEGANIVGVFVPQHYVGGGGYQHYSKFTPILGSVGRPWNGDIGEIIAFRRVLTEAECCVVENYLMAKWNPTRTTRHADAECVLPSKRNVLPVTTELSLGTEATLDLNGGEQTVAKLDGVGAIVNTSTNAAKLVVTGASDFHGRVDGNVTLVLPAGARGIMMRNGAKLVVSGAGESPLTAANPRPPLHDLAFWIDASQGDLVTADAGGKVTRIACREGERCDAPDFHYAGWGSYLTYVANGWNEGKPAFYVNAADTYYHSGNGSGSDKSTTVRTFFYVARLMDSGAGAYVFGPDGQDVGMTAYAWNGGYTVNCRGPSLLNTSGDLLRLNGEDKTSAAAGNFSVSRSDNAICYVMRVCDSHRDDGHMEGKVMCLGSHSGTRAVKQYVGEMIAYTVQLTDAEILEIEKYLMDKWLNSGRDWPASETLALDGTCGLGVAGGATLDLGADDIALATLGCSGGTVKAGSLMVLEGMDFLVDNGVVDAVTVDGDLTFGPQAVARFVNGGDLEKSKRSQMALTVTGEVTGGFAGVEGLPRKCRLTRSGNTWRVGCGGIMLTFR